MTKQVEVVFEGELPELAVIIAREIPFRLDECWFDGNLHNPYPFEELVRKFYPECNHVHVVPTGEIQCACGTEKTFRLTFSKFANSTNP